MFNTKQEDEYNELEHIISKSKQWNCSLFFNENEPKQTPSIVDLCEQMESGQDYTFPKRFFGLSSKKQLMKELKMSGIQSGFHIDVRSSKQSDKCANYLDQILYISCVAGIKYTPTKPKKYKKTSKKKKRKYIRKKKKNKTLTWRYKDEKKNVRFLSQFI